ncbi:MAG TPA: ABC transporter permease, partial [Vicinamibacteria bacterium]
MSQGARALLRRPAFTAVALLTIAIGVAANAAVFTVVDALLLAPLPFGPRSERVVLLHATHSSQGGRPRESRLSYADLQDVRGSSRLLEDVAGYFRRPLTVGVDGEVERVEGAVVTPNLFKLIGAAPQLGHTFDEEGGPGVERAVIV